MCFFSPSSSLAAPPERLSPVKPVSRLDSPRGRVSNDRVPRHPTPSPRQTPFHLFPVVRNTSSSLLLRDHGAGCTNTPFYSPHDFVSHAFSSYVVTEYSYIRAIMHSPLVSPKPPCIRSFRVSAPLPRTLTSAVALTAAPEPAYIIINTVHHSPPYLHRSLPKTRHAWYASHTNPR